MTIKQDFYNVDEFWGYVEAKLYCNVPQYIKNLLKIRYLDEPLTLKEINDDVIEQLETFVKSGGLAPYIPENADLKEYFGVFHQTQHKFKIVPGHKVLLKYIVEFVSHQIETIGPEFYKR